MIAVNTNVSAIMSSNYSRLSDIDFGDKVQRLSTGNRINRGAIDPSGLAIASGMMGHLRGTDTAMSNALDDINLLRTADAVLDDIQSVLMEMRDLSVRLANEAAVAANPSGNPLAPKPATVHQAMELQKQIELLKDHLYNSFRIQETGAPSRVIASLISYNTKNLFDTTGALSNQGFGGDGQGTQIGADNQAAHQVQIIFNDIAEVIMDFATPYDPPLPADSTPMSWYAAYALDKIDDITDKLNLISDVRIQIGTWDMRLQHTLDDLQAGYLSVSAAKSRIEDANMAQEITEFTKTQIRKQTEMMVASQATAVPRIAIPLLSAIYDGMMPGQIGLSA